MPCNSDHLEPRHHETESRIACQNIVYLCAQLERHVPKLAIEGAMSIYGAPDYIDEATVMLCGLCKDAGDDVIYNGRDPQARQLADWWDTHQEADRARAIQERLDRGKAVIRLKMKRKNKIVWETVHLRNSRPWPARLEGREFNLQDE